MALESGDLLATVVLDDSGDHEADADGFCDNGDEGFFTETSQSLGKIHMVTTHDVYHNALARPGHIEHWRSVTLGHMSRTITDAALIAMAINTPQLRALDLTYAESVTEAGLIDFVGRVPELTALTLRRCSQSATDPALARLALCCPHLTRLDVSFCSLVTDYGVGVIADRCPQLAELTLYGCNWVTDAAAAKVLHFTPPMARTDV